MGDEVALEIISLEAKIQRGEKLTPAEQIVAAQYCLPRPTHCGCGCNQALHGPGGEDDHKAVAALLNDGADSWRRRSVFIGRTVFDERARIVGRFPPKRSPEG